jgi:lipase maturation factor 1
MWFAALGPPPRWFPGLLARLLEGSPEVMKLLGDNPFPDRPPRFVRALLYQLHATDIRTRKRSGLWWRRELVGTYFPACAHS